MYSTFLSVALFALPVLADFAINSPVLKQCEPANISWEPTNGPYNLIVVPAANRCGDALVEVGDFDKTTTTWKANIAAGTEVILSLVDADDNEAWSKKITVADSDDDSCLPGGKTPSPPSSSSPAASDSSAPPSASSPASSPPPPSNYGSGDSDAGIVPIGAANAGTNPFGSDGTPSGAITARQAGAPAIAITVLAAIFALTL